MVAESVKIKDVLFVDFFEALKTNDYESLNITEDEYIDLSNEYKKLANIKSSLTDKQLQKIYVENTILKNCVFLLEVKGYDKDLIELIREYGHELYPDNVDEIINDFKKRIKSLDMKISILKSQSPKVDEQKTTSAYDIIAQLSLGLEMKLNSKTFTVLEYISYSKALKEKVKQINKLHNGSNKR